ncbi:TetR/AcrR family transcriptional regulator [Collinsella provencensis]|uniref:TetR/AcrR family transcriptional regulator n=1 Tax=Collinsella provencensis TaxID=1937461 RepID=UPI000C83FA90|nr:TetR/AcrR family transcriptional regulator [Collinsella provencensis]
MEEKKNRNALRSIRLLEEAYLELLSEKDAEKISVTDVTRRADLNRGTFYAHYDGIHDLESSLTEKLVQRLTVILEEVMDSSFLQNPRPILDRIGAFLIENSDLLHRLVFCKKLLPVIALLEERLREQMISKLTVEYPDEMPFIFFITDYVVGGMLHAYTSWLSGKGGDVTITEVNDALERLIRSTRTVTEQ